MRFKPFIFLLPVLTLVSCNSTSESNISNTVETDNQKISNETIQNETVTNLTNEAIVVYYSATNNTRRVANYIADYIDKDIYELEPITPYTSEDLNYNSSTSRVSIEHNDENRHVELKETSFEKFREAKYVFLGAPVWWGRLSWVIDDFLKNNDFSLKTIIPFGTSASSSFSIDYLKEYTSDSTTWLSGKRFASSTNENTVTEWVDSLNIQF